MKKITRFPRKLKKEGKKFEFLYYDEEDMKDNSLYRPSKKCMEIYDNFDKFIRK